MSENQWSFDQAVERLHGTKGEKMTPLEWEQAPPELLKPEPTDATDVPAAPAPVAPMTRAERKVKLQSVVDKIIHYADAHPEAMLDDNGAQINKLMDLFQKMDDREEEKAPALDKLTAADLQKMTLSEFRLVLIEVVMQHVPEDRQEAALRMLRR